MPKPLEDEFDAAVQLTSQQNDLPWLSNIERKAMRAGREEGRRLGLEHAIVAVLCGRQHDHTSTFDQTWTRVLDRCFRDYMQRQRRGPS